MSISIDFDLSTITIALLVFAIHSIISIKLKKRNKWYIFFLFFFYSYLLGVSKYTIFPIDLSDSMRNVFVGQTLKDITVLKLISPLTKNFILNVIMTFPMGILFPFVSKNCNKIKIIFVAIMSGIIIELLQYLQFLIQGFTFRRIDINDIIANFIGVTVGYLVLKIFSFLFYKIFNEKDIMKSELLMYINCSIKSI